MREYTIFTLGNDAVIDWLIAFLNSLRSVNESVQVKIIPFDDEIEQLKKLESEFGFEIIKDPMLDELEQIGTSFWDGNVISGKTWRKLFCFVKSDTPFLFLDSDIVINEDPDLLFDIYNRSGAQFMCFDIDETQVYKNGSFRKKMQEEYGAISFNTGGFISRNGLLDLEGIKEKAQKIYDKKVHFLGWGDQTFINYLIDTSDIKVEVFSDVDTTYSHSTWAKNRITYTNGKAAVNNKTMPFVHWAGFDIGQFMPSKAIFVRWRLYGAFQKDKKEVDRKLVKSVLGFKMIKSIIRRLLPQSIKNTLRDFLYKL